MTTILTTNILNRLDPDTQRTILDARLDDLIERRGVQDPGLFRWSFFLHSPEDSEGWIHEIENFTDQAHDAFQTYHDYRAKGAAWADGKGPVFPDITEEEIDEAVAEEYARELEAEAADPCDGCDAGCKEDGTCREEGGDVV